MGLGRNYPGSSVRHCSCVARDIWLARATVRGSNRRCPAQAGRKGQIWDVREAAHEHACHAAAARTYSCLVSSGHSLTSLFLYARLDRRSATPLFVKRRGRYIGQLAQQRRSGRMDSGQQNGWRWRRHVTPAATERCIDPIHLSRRPFCPTTPIRCFLLFSSAVVRV